MRSPPPPATSPYPPAILRWARDRSRRGTSAGPAAHVRSGHAHNRTCGDRVAFHLAEDLDGQLTTVRFDADGCALCLAASAALAEHLEGHPMAEAAATIARLHAALARVGPPDDSGAIGEGLDAFVVVAPFPARHRCVTLCAEAAQNALDVVPDDAAP